MKFSEKRARARLLLAQAKALGDERFDGGQNLIRAVNGPRHTGHVVAQQSLEYAIALLETGGEGVAERANGIVRRVLEFQVRAPRHHRYGNFRWMAHWEEPNDPNAVAFLVPNLVYLYRRHAGALEPETLAAMERSFPLCAEALLRREVPYEYTNIKLLTILGQFLLAPLLPESALESTACFHWKHFVGFTAQYGLAEYNSPTYLPVCLYALERLWECGPKDMREPVGRMLEYCYFEFAARYHAPSGYLAGAMSRAYPADVETGQGLGALVAHLQWGEPLNRLDNLNMVGFLLNGYEAPEEIRRIALEKALPVEIRATAWQPQLIRRTDYLAPEFSVGSQDGYCGNQEVPLFISVVGAAERRSVFLEASAKGLAALTSRQRGAEVVGHYYYDWRQVRDWTEIRSRQPDLPLAIHWRLGSRELVGKVAVDGVEWEGQQRNLGGEVGLNVGLGLVTVGLRVEVDERSSMELRWEEEELVLAACISPRAADFVAAGESRGLRFGLRVATAMGQAVGLGLDEVETARPITAPPAVQYIHDSGLARILPNDLLRWLNLEDSRSPIPFFAPEVRGN